MNSLTEQIIVNILAEEMSLDPDSIWIRRQNRKIPTTTGLFVVVGLIDAQPVSNVTYMLTESGEQHQISEVQQREIIQIDLLSRDNSALTRR